MNQTLCPYAVLPLTSGESNDEHILPVALGAPPNFTVRALAAENSRMNDLIDAPTANDELLRFLAMKEGVVSRSGSVKAAVSGVVRGTNEPVTATFSRDGLDLKFSKPVITDGEGRVIAVRGFGDDAKLKAAQVAKNYAKKGVSVKLGDERTNARPELGFQFEADMGLIRRQLYKIAYLTTVRIFGDQAIRGMSGQQLRAAMMAERDTDPALRAINSQVNRPLPPSVARSSGTSEHAITCAFVPTVGILTAVHLFGHFSLCAVTSAKGFVADPFKGEVLRIALASSKLTSRPYLEALEEFMPGTVW